MSADMERRKDTGDIERRIDQVDSKVDRLGDRVEHNAERLQSSVELLIKTIDQRFDLSMRQQDQAIALLTSGLVQAQQDIAATDTQLEMALADNKRLATKHDVLAERLVEQKKLADHIHDEQAARIEILTDNQKWTTRAIASALITAVVSVAVFVLTH